MHYSISKLLLPLLAACALGFGCEDDKFMGVTAGSAAVASSGSALATIKGFMGGTVTGTAQFSKASGSDVTLTVSLDNCVDGQVYPIHIHSGSACTDALTQGDHWGPRSPGSMPPTRGDGIMSVTCKGTSGMSVTTRASGEPSIAWSIGGGDMNTNVIGHVMVLHAPNVPMMPPRIGCGLIMPM